MKDEIIIAGENKLENILCRNTIELIKYARTIATKHINFIQLMTFFSIGKWIVDEQQKGETRAKYGEFVIVDLSEKLLSEFGRGFSKDTLKNARKFYLMYKDRISETVFNLFVIEKAKQCLAF